MELQWQHSVAKFGHFAYWVPAQLRVVPHLSMEQCDAYHQQDTLTELCNSSIVSVNSAVA